MSNPCSICLEDLTIVFRLNCGHSFHFNCIRLWAVTSSQCPYCRKAICENDLRDLFGMSLRRLLQKIYEQVPNHILRDISVTNAPVECPCCKERINVRTERVGYCANCFCPTHLECSLNHVTCSVCCAVTRQLTLI
ncbi:hypothetical protein TNCT_555901 [Trichonephila clavata]|uniref:RING-type E3 ubiquitin transferase n=1 Tax=Trichonephila clavata TaxID=2740835 RepID=A0A8X6ILG4_TRICU|nr:hypothetical protein TNCT_445351 [Trichonephila clavata]GFQ94804.1 hypothetical protein TNCT_707001 [Trichonephila clavata]GFR07005.1 hypothetical protein TNCT_555901 [Trichonephila clavata]